LFKTEADIIKAFEDAGEDLANKIKSPGWLFKIRG